MTGPCFGCFGSDGYVLPTLGLQRDVQWQGAEPRDSVELGDPLLGRSGPSAVADHFDPALHVDRGVGEVLDLEREDGRFACVKDVALGTGVDQGEAAGAIGLVAVDLKGFVEAGRVAGLAEVEGGRSEALSRPRQGQEGHSGPKASETVCAGIHAFRLRTGKADSRE